MFIDGWFVATTSPPPGTRPGGGHRQEAEKLLPHGYMTWGERVFHMDGSITKTSLFNRIAPFAITDGCRKILNECAPSFPICRHDSLFANAIVMFLLKLIIN